MIDAGLDPKNVAGEIERANLTAAVIQHLVSAYRSGSYSAESPCPNTSVLRLKHLQMLVGRADKTRSAPDAGRACRSVFTRLGSHRIGDEPACIMAGPLEAIALKRRDNTIRTPLQLLALRETANADGLILAVAFQRELRFNKIVNSEIPCGFPNS
jgi:hypothetical protein